ncbi:uncharacterized protein BYT42DRAFT_618369 [Radiomyces spectabilis]|uniref:uncharacterized protein n=1 Tax=Radiomyces spectabilis TaxID=64574 RepID=UPI002220D9A3|nr:uncharacterized protein BYT42DRAFT_618369 [Radiomyces spectabilis]KAI8365916.1 hypothetical protein BYT42DRAFT_618369 [Radiomyces spectabilis]
MDRPYDSASRYRPSVFDRLGRVQDPIHARDRQSRPEYPGDYQRHPVDDGMTRPEPILSRRRSSEFRRLPPRGPIDIIPERHISRYSSPPPFIPSTVSHRDDRHRMAFPYQSRHEVSPRRSSQDRLREPVRSDRYRPTYGEPKSQRRRSAEKMGPLDSQQNDRRLDDRKLHSSSSYRPSSYPLEPQRIQPAHPERERISHNDIRYGHADRGERNASQHERGSKRQYDTYATTDSNQVSQEDSHRSDKGHRTLERASAPTHETSASTKREACVSSVETGEQTKIAQTVERAGSPHVVDAKSKNKRDEPRKRHATVRKASMKENVISLDLDDDEIMRPDWGGDSEDEAQLLELKEKERPPSPRVPSVKDKEESKRSRSESSSQAVPQNKVPPPAFDEPALNKKDSDELPHPWRQVLSRKGQVYYHNPETGKSVWDRPTIRSSATKDIDPSRANRSRYPDPASRQMEDQVPAPQKVGGIRADTTRCRGRDGILSRETVTETTMTSVRRVDSAPIVKRPRYDDRKDMNFHDRDIERRERRERPERPERTVRYEDVYPRRRPSVQRFPSTAAPNAPFLFDDRRRRSIDRAMPLSDRGRSSYYSDRNVPIPRRDELFPERPRRGDIGYIDRELPRGNEPRIDSPRRRIYR